MNTEDTTPKQSPGILAWLIIVLALFMLRIHPWMSSELWYDEILSLQRFILPHEDNLTAIFTDYPIANNHMLATALNAAWMSLTGNVVIEYVIRFMSLLSGIATIAIVMLHWKRFLGERLALLGGLLLAVSPIFTAYVYQLRGYSLTMLLSAIAVTGIIELAERHRARGIITLSLSGVLLPLVMPSNLMLAPVIVVMCIAVMRTKALPWRSCILASLLWCFSVIFGFSHYLTILTQFRKVIAEPDGWNSPAAVAGNILLAFCAHGIAILIACLFACFKHQNDSQLQDNVLQAPDGQSLEKTNNTPNTLSPQTTALSDKSCLLFSAVAFILTIAASLAVSRSGHAPFPRVYLVMLLPATFVLLYLAKAIPAFLKLAPACIVAAIIVNGVLWERISEGLTDNQIRHGQTPDNLLQQYYRGSSDLRDIAIAPDVKSTPSAVITDPYDIMSFQFYWMTVAQQNPQLAFAVNAVPDKFWQLVPDHDTLRLLTIARTPEGAAEMFSKAGFGETKTLTKRLDVVYETPSRRRRVYRLK